MRSLSRLSLCIVVQLLVLIVGGAPTWPASTPRVTLAWDDTVNTDQDGYLVRRRAGTSGSAYATLASTDATTRTYIDSAVVVNQKVCYVIEAFRNADGDVSSPSNEVCLRVRRQ
jgi:hypothetical protein